MFMIHNKLMVIMGSDMLMRVPLIYNNYGTQERDLVDDFWNKWQEFNNNQRNIMRDDTLFSTMIEDNIYEGNYLVFYQTLYEIMLFNPDIMIDSFANLIWNITTNESVKIRLYGECKNIDINDCDQIDELKYLPLVINESARLNPGIAITFAETITEDLVLNNQYLQAGTMISLDTQMINRDPNVWRNPHQFDPDRFDTGDASVFHSYHRFGLGPRKCLGNVFGDYILKIGIVALLQNFDLIISDKNNNNLVREQRNTIPNLCNYNMTNSIDFIRR